MLSFWLAFATFPGAILPHAARVAVDRRVVFLICSPCLFGLESIQSTPGGDMIVRDLFEWVVGTILWVVLCGLVVTSSCDDRAEAIARATSNGTVVMTVPTEAQIVNKAVFEEIQRVLDNMGAACTAPSGRNAAIAVR